MTSRPARSEPPGLKSSPMLRLFKADEVLNDDRGWTFNLAIFRLVFLAGAALPLALDVVRWTEQVMPGLPRDVWAPMSFYRYLPFDIIRSVTFAYWLAVGNVLLICLGLLGVFTRWTLGLATIVSLYTLGLMQNQGKVDHFHHVIWFMALLAIGPSAHFLSVDALLSAVRRADRGITEPTIPRSAALWTLRYTWILLGLLYLIPGLAKLEKTLTAGWGTAENLRAVMWQVWFELRLYKPGFQLPWRADTLPSSVLELVGIGVIVFEVGFIALVLFRPVRPFLALGGLAFHIGNGLVLHIWFSKLLAAYVCLFDGPPWGGWCPSVSRAPHSSFSTTAPAASVEGPSRSSEPSTSLTASRLSPEHQTIQGGVDILKSQMTSSRTTCMRSTEIRLLTGMTPTNGS